MVTKSQILSIFLVLCVGNTIGQALDTSFIQSYYDKVVPRVTWTFKTQRFEFENTSHDTISKASFETGEQFLVGGTFSYKWINFGGSISLRPNQRVNNKDFGFVLAYRPIRIQFNINYLTELDYNFVKSVNGYTTDSIVSYRQNDLIILTSRLKIDYIFNYRKYSHSAGLAQNAKQLKSAGSFIASLAPSNEKISVNKEGSAIKTKIDSINKYNTLVNGIDLGLGYGYNFVFGHHWTIALNDIPNLGYQLIKSGTHYQEKYYPTLGLSNHLRAAVLYTKQNFFTGFSAYHLLSTSFLKDSKYRTTSVSIQFCLGYVFRAPKLMQKIPF